MIFTRQGLPEEDEIIICTVKKILHNSVFVYLNEYKNKEGMLHISEIAPGRIRNIRDYVKPNKKIVCKVLRIDQKTQHIDVSLRRVPLTIKTKKTEEYKQELRAEKLILNIAKQKKLSQEETYQKLAKPLIEKYDSLTNAFNKILVNEKILTDLKIPFAKFITETIKEKIKLPEVQINANIKLTSYESEGITKIKNILKKVLAFAKTKKYKIEFNYTSAPNYSLRVKAKNYKQAENILKETIDNITAITQQTNTILEWEKKS